MYFVLICKRECVFCKLFVNELLKYTLHALRFLDKHIFCDLNKYYQQAMKWSIWVTFLICQLATLWSVFCFCFGLATIPLNVKLGSSSKVEYWLAGEINSKVKNRELQLFIHCITAVDVHVSYKFPITKVLRVQVAGHFSIQQKVL